MVGFAASVYKRGVRFGFIPTTLLSQVDASIGGKNGVNLDSYKNMIGVFRQPEMTFICPEPLETLPYSQIVSGAAELLKSFIIDNEDEVLDYHVERVKKAYPAYFDTYEHIDDLRNYLDTIPNLFCVGRNGQHRYNNLDHSMCTSFEAVKDILEGKTDKSNVWNVNTEKEYHESK